MAKYLKIITFVFPFVFIGLMIYMTINHRAFYYSGTFTGEGGLIEDLTVVVYALATLIGALVTVKLFRCNHAVLGCLYLGLTLGLFFIGGEELSWGQRGFQWQTPEVLMRFNNQGETNIHNILGSSALGALYIVAGFYGAFSRLLVPARLQVRYRFALSLLTPDWFLALYFFPVFALYLYYSCFWWWFGPVFNDDAWYSPQSLIIARHQEVIELLMGLGFLAFVLVNAYRLYMRRSFAESGQTISSA